MGTSDPPVIVNDGKLSVTACPSGMRWVLGAEAIWIVPSVPSDELDREREHGVIARAYRSPCLIEEKVPLGKRPLSQG